MIVSNCSRRMSAAALEESMNGDSAEASAHLVLTPKILSRKKNIHDNRKERKSDL